MSREVEDAIVVASVVLEGLDLRNFLSNSEVKNVAEMEGIGKVERDTISSMVKEIGLEEERNISLEIVDHHIHYSIDQKKNIGSYLMVVAPKAFYTQ